MQHFATTLRPGPTRLEQGQTVYMPRELKTCTHIFVKVRLNKQTVYPIKRYIQDPIKPNFTPVYSGPFYRDRIDKTFGILSNDCVISVAINNAKATLSA